MSRFLSALLSMLLAWPALAGVTVSFHSRDTGAVLQHFPHGFFAVEGTMEAGGAPVDANYGFTAKAVSPAILFGSVGGEIVSMGKAYVTRSDRHMAFRISDADYAKLIALVEKWKAIPGKSYDLKRRNCVFFVAEAARILGLDAPDQPKLMLKPRSFLEAVVARNREWLAVREQQGTPLQQAASGPIVKPQAVEKDELAAEKAD